MDEHQDPEGTTQSGKDNLKDAAGDLKEAASAKSPNKRPTPRAIKTALLGLLRTKASPSACLLRK